MPQLMMSRREFAGVPVTLTIATDSLSGNDQPRHVVALGWISRNGGQVIISERLNQPTVIPAGR